MIWFLKVTKLHAQIMIMVLVAVCSPGWADGPKMDKMPEANAALKNFTEAAPARISLVTYRGCEEACLGFQRYFSDRNLPVKVTVTDVDRDKSKLPGILKDLRAEKPDLVVTWGTSNTKALIGTREQYGDKTALGEIPALFMIVADPVGADIIESYEYVGRKNVSGVRNRVPEDVQLKTLFTYFFPKTLGVVNNPAELNSKLNTKRVENLSKSLGFNLVALEYAVNEDGKPDPADIPLKIAQMKQKGVDAIYVGSSSFNLEHSDEFTGAALETGIPVFSAYEQMVRDSNSLMAVGSSYSNVGKLAGSRAYKLLFEGADPETLPVATLDRFSIFLNMKVARKLKLYPPIQLISIAEVIR